jgi:hypothetical protein
LIVGEPREQDDPVVEIAAFVYHAHVLLIVADDFNKVTHYIREKCHSTQHNHDSRKPFPAAHWVIISISNGTQSGKRIITADNELVWICVLVETVVRYEIGLCWAESAEVEPAAPNKVSYDYCYYDKSEYLVNLHQAVLSRDLLISRSFPIAHYRIQQLVETTYVDQFDEPGQPEQSEKLSELTIIFKQELERKNWYEIYEEPPFKDVLPCYLSKIFYLLVGLLVDVSLEEV